METKKIKNRTELIIFIAGVCAVLVVINYLADKWFGRADMTEGKEYSISAASKNVLKHLDDIINVKVTSPKTFPRMFIRPSLMSKTFFPNTRHMPEIRLKIIWEDPADE